MVVFPQKCMDCKWFKTLDPEECSKHCDECKDELVNRELNPKEITKNG